MTDPEAAPLPPTASTDPGSTSFFERAWTVPAIPAAVSFVLSAVTVGSHPYWQDSSLFLRAVHGLGILYPHGFVLYLLLCRGWTILLSPFFTFTLSVHLFSSACAAAAAGVLALAAERFTRHRPSAIAVGILAATGYTWGFAAIYAKGYSLYYLLLCLLLWSMLRRDLRLTAVFLGLSWAAHPSMGLFAPAIVAFLWVCRQDLRERGLLQGVGLAVLALGCAVGPLLLLPVLSLREPVMALGNPRTAGDLVDYALGRRFTTLQGTWGLDSSRVVGAARFLGEELLVAGSLAVLAGIWAMWNEGRQWLGAALLWSLPFATTVVLFRVEGQYDLWLVAVYLALYLVSARGLAVLAKRWKGAPWTAIAVALASWLVVNRADLRSTQDGFPERLAKDYLQHLEPGAVFVAETDDAIGLLGYLQEVQGYRADVCVVDANLLAPGEERRWYLDRLRKRFPDLAAPAYGSVTRSGTYSLLNREKAAFVNPNARGKRALYLERDADVGLFLPGLALVPSGVAWRVTVDGHPEKPNPDRWKLELGLEEAAAAHRDRNRGQVVLMEEDGIHVFPESYRDRMLAILLGARQAEAYLYHLQGTPSGHRQAIELYESMMLARPEENRRPEVLFPLSGSYMAINRLERAEPLLKTLLEQPLTAAMESASRWYLADICKATGRPKEAREQLERALRHPELDRAMRKMLEDRLKEGN